VSSAAMRRLPADSDTADSRSPRGGTTGRGGTDPLCGGKASYPARRGVRSRRRSTAVERAWPRAELIWPRDEVFIARRDASAPTTAASPRRRPTPARGSR
jgi:hypothetical protein